MVTVVQGEDFQLRFRFVVLGMFALFLLLFQGCGDSSECEEYFDCDISNGEYCDPSGTCKCLWWENRTITFYVNENCSSDLPLDGCLSAIRAAIDYWNAPECSDVVLVFGGTTIRQDVGYDPDSEDNINLIIWLESDWQTHGCPNPEEPCRPQGSELSSTAYSTDTGQVFDTDIEFNGETIEYSETLIESRMVHHFGDALGVRDLESLCERFPTGEPCPCADELP